MNVLHTSRRAALASFAAVLLCLGALRRPAGAADAAGFVKTLEGTLRGPEVYLGGTTLLAPLITPGNALVAFLRTTQETVDTMVALIENARHEVLLQVYEYDDTDEAAQKVGAALAKRVRLAASSGQPFVARIVVSRAWPQEHNLQQRDLEALIEELQQQANQAQNVVVTLSVYRGSLLSILHTKTMIVDGTTGLVMTGNLSTHGGISRDSVNMAAQVSGPVVDTLRADWATAFTASHLHKAAGHQAADLQLCRPARRKASPALPIQSGLTAAVLTRPSRWAPWADSGQNPQNLGIVALLNAASHQINIINPSLGAEPVQRALVEAILARGVVVTAILSRNMNAAREHYLFGGNNQEQTCKLYRELLDKGGPSAVSKLRVLWGSADAKRPSAAHAPGNIHAKVCSIDDDALLIGSTNFNWLSFNTSRELTLALLGTNAAADFKRNVWPFVHALAVPMRYALESDVQAPSGFVLTCKS